MKICAISDIHGQFDKVSINDCDILFICGDIVPLFIQRNVPQSFSWFKKKFIPWCLNQPTEHIYLIWGNHDYLGEAWDDKCKKELEYSDITILTNEGATYLDTNTGKEYSIWGSPLCHIFGDWAFMLSDEREFEEFNKIPDNLDFLITHDCPYGRNDQCLGFTLNMDRQLHRGNVSLVNVLEKKKPKYHFTGHLHTADHDLVNYDGTKTACVSLLNENYEMTYDPLYLEIDDKE